MVRPTGLPWRRILGLHVVRHVEAVARARGLQLGWVDLDSREVRAAHTGDAACSDAIVRALREADGDGTVTVSCPHELRELVAPIAGGDRPVGALTLGSFAGDAEPAEVELMATLLAEAARDVASVVAASDAAPVVGARDRYGAIIGGAPAMQELYALLDRVARSDSTVLVQGENGTGKELVARAIHDNSLRAGKRFVVTNCSAFNDNLLDSELFGHKRGAFTGAVADKPGLFEVADTDTRKVDVRIIAATNRDLKTMVERGQFREDLYYRINVINLVLPSLRQRKEDIPVLVAFFLDRHRRNAGLAKQLSPECLGRMMTYPWPGNVRELENEIERLVVLSGEDAIIQEDLLSARIRQHAAPPGEEAREAEPSSLPEAVEALEKRMILDALRRNRWNKTRASADLKVSRRNLIRLVQKYGLEPAG